jgi:hypothetical protein
MVQNKISPYKAYKTYKEYMKSLINTEKGKRKKEKGDS